MSGSRPLNSRLRLCADFVRRGARVADVGTDHAYLPVWLCRNGISPSAVAADINPEPLARGALTVKSAGLEDRVQLRLSDGLQAIGEEEADDVVIAGMGGELIAAILAGCPYAKSPGKHFILQPMTKSVYLIEWLCENGFAIDRQDCCVAGGKCYTVLSVYAADEPTPADRLFFYTGKLCPREHETHRLFLQKQIERLRKQARGDAQYGEIADRLEEYCDNGKKDP